MSKKCVYDSCKSVSDDKYIGQNDFRCLTEALRLLTLWRPLLPSRPG